jgi:hypothetical protein
VYTPDASSLVPHTQPSQSPGLFDPGDDVSLSLVCRVFQALNAFFFAGREGVWKSLHTQEVDLLIY